MIAAITVLAIVGMSVSWMVAETTQGNGEAINVAGSLRMQSWRMASLYQQNIRADTPESHEQLQLAIAQFERDLRAGSILSVLPEDETTPLKRVYRQVEADWRRRVLPRLGNPTAATGRELLVEIPLFVAHINDLVKQIEEATEAKIFVLRVILGGAVIGTILMVILSIYLISSILVNPLKDLLSLTDEIRRGKLTVRSGLTGEDEIGQLGRAFDLMAEDLFKLYRDLEARVEQKTAELTRSNRSLDLLYRSITRLHGISPDREVFQNVLKDAETTLGLGIGTICLKGDNEARGKVIATTAPNNASPLCQHASNCTECHNPYAIRMDSLPNGRQVLRLPLADAEKRYGLLAVDVPPDTQAETWQVQLLEALSHHIGVTIASEQRIEQHRRVSLLEERAVIARELHDSLAQSLAYMKIQVSRLRNAIQEPDDVAEVMEALEELRDGLNSSYQQLRELLSTFRLRMEDADFGMALAQTTAEFAERGKLPIELEASLDNLRLTPNEEIHLLQIAREGLSNVLKHARASRAWVRLHARADGAAELLIDDDGVGILKNATLHHYGIAIMSERSRALHGSLEHLPREGGGTRVQMTFTPSLPPQPSETRIPHAA
ncbi:MAG: type IV pili methyl-accepting chemotaxis transducer N-terminal domain-containing protein [Gammaproteobacteria bacterium]|nr:type IV pili methyl-accepting chemotaxis transducer N-terminal domain-containing protein [Gammaproteobacteria bacterium]MBU1725192.1 type IV pili methyl-accepting chemotaxis transducer N-terminal domain-containing protein [Gammaproteobacteria bacterium]MBU2005114.1 type IV pili methyl-accepting chemotaxis transducer N-terminal domain-containing protein [Gammaproteobacteria bacterium]